MSTGRTEASPPARPAAWSINARAVFDTLLTHGRLTRGEIADHTGLSRVTASGVVEQLIRRGLVDHAGTVPWSSGGPNARTYQLARDAAYVVGVAAYLDRITLGVATITGETVARAEADVDADQDTATVVHQLILDAITGADAPLDRLRRVVVGTQGVVDPAEDSHIAFVTNVRSWQSELTSRLRTALGCPVVFENDVNLAAMTEMHLGAGRGVHNLVLVWMDDGIGLGTVVNGRLVHGDNGWAGEIGFIPAPITGPDDARAGDGERVSTVQAALGSLGVFALGELHGIASGDFLGALRDGFPAVATRDALYAELAHRAALAIAPAILIVDPDVVVVAGAIAEAGGQPLLDRTIAALRELGPVPVPVVLSELETDAVMEGAVLLALEEARHTIFEDARFAAAATEETA